MSDRRRTGEGGDDRQLAREVLEDLAAQTWWEEREPAQRRGDEVTERGLLVGVAAEATEESWRIEHERRPDHRHAGGEHPLERQPQLPAACCSRLEQ